jgi:membrane fusion protein (multidrug efflux system)
MVPFTRKNISLFISLAMTLVFTPVFSQDADPYSSDIGSFEQEFGSQDQALNGIDGDMNFECLLEPFMTVNIGSAVPGALSDVYVKRGDVVKKGQTVAKIDSRVQVAGLELAKTRYDYSKRRLERSEDLATEKFLSSQETDELETNALMAKQELTEREMQLEIRRIRSPLTGVVVERHKGPGEYVQESEILELAQIDPLIVEVVVPVQYFGEITPGMVVEVSPQQPVGGLYEAKVKVIDKVIDAASGTFGVRLEIANPGNKIPAGLRCDARFKGL